VKEKRTYKRFDLISFLAILACSGMLLFECIFIFELYDRSALPPSGVIPAAIETPVVPAEPIRRESADPVEVPPAQIETPPAAVPVG
jgi:hypothetical protein